MSVREKWLAMSRRRTVAVSEEYLRHVLRRQNGRCALSGRSIGFNDDVDGTDTASPDRIDSDKDYLVGNIQWVHKDFNKLKNKWSQNEFISMCEEVVRCKKAL